MHADENPEIGGSPRNVVEQRPPDPATILLRLRGAFPDWGFVHDPGTGVWTALHGNERDGVTIQRSDPLALKLMVEQTLRGHQ